jgi:hypothetical protein
VDWLALQLDSDDAAARQRAVYDAMLRDAPAVRDPDFEWVTPEDLSLLFDLYDARFFDGEVHELLRTRAAAPLTFAVSTRMTRSGGMTKRFGRRRGRKRPTYEIAIAARLLQLSYGDTPRPVHLCGLLCHNRLEALQRIMEHEIIHLLEWLVWDASSCKQPRFKTLARNLFNHTAVHHEMIRPAEHAAHQHDLRLGQMAAFDAGGETLVGRINRINQRATLLVESPDGERYRDGKRYVKYYVPLEMLRAVVDH